MVIGSDVKFYNSPSFDFGFDETEDQGETGTPTVSRENSTGAITLNDVNETFHANPSNDSAGFYAPNVAITCDVGDNAIANISTAFFGKAEPGRDKVALFVRYLSKTDSNKLTFNDLVAGIPGNVSELVVSIDRGQEETWTSESFATLTVDADEHPSQLFVVRYYVPVTEGDPLVYRTNVFVVDSSTSVVMSQFDMTDINVAGEGISVGVSIRILSADPVSKWTIGWGDDDTTEVTNYGFTCNAYHFYRSAGAYDLNLTVDAGEPYNLGKVVANGDVPAAPTTTNPDDESGSGATIDLDIFSDGDFFDELFEI